MSLSGNHEYRDFMEKLAEANVGEYIDLPMIAVMGDTSSGKSSLLSMISTVELPSSDKLTTRCPTLLDMTKSTEKRAEVSIQWKDGTKGKHFNPIEIGASNWDQLTESIRKAQEFIIKATGKEVSRNVVRVKMFGPECEDLSLVDLPGIVRSRGKGESESLSTEIQALMEEYLQNSRCVVLAVHPCNVDFHNSQIMNEARKVDPNTERTIPVLTKPDLIDDGAEGEVKQLLLGLKTDEFIQGFHMVKGRGQKALNENVSISAALDQEEKFFASTKPWSDFRRMDYFGTKSLRVKLGELQMNTIRQEFPKIEDEIRKKREKAAEQLKLLGAMPNSSGERRSTFSSLKDYVIGRIENMLVGGNIDIEGSDDTKETVASEFLRESAELKAKLGTTRLASVTAMDVGQRVKYKSGGNEATGVIERFPYESTATVTDDKTGTVVNVNVDTLELNSAWLQELCAKNRGLELPIFPSYTLFHTIVLRLMREEWIAPCDDLAMKTYGLINGRVKRLLSRSHKLQAFPRLRTFLTSTATATCAEFLDDSRRRIKENFEKEESVYTQNEKLAERNNGSNPQEEEVDAAKINASALATPTPPKKEADRDLAVEEMISALDAYGKIAYDRVSDDVPAICMRMLRNYHTKLNERLQAVTDEDLNEHMLVPDSVRDKYDNCKKEYETLDQSLMILKSS